MLRALKWRLASQCECEREIETENEQEGLLFVCYVFKGFINCGGVFVCTSILLNLTTLTKSHRTCIFCVFLFFSSFVFVTAHQSVHPGSPSQYGGLPARLR